MKCADCQGDLKQLDFRGIKIEGCPECKGYWFDRGELTKAKDYADQDLCWLDFDPFGEAANQFLVDSQGKDCPRCQVKMDSLSYEKSGVIVNKCLVCQGIWLRDEEFKKIISYLENIVAAETSSEYVRDSLKKFLEIFSGKEDMISEAKDFLVVLKLMRRRIAAEHPELVTTVDKIYEFLPFL